MPRSKLVKPTQPDESRQAIIASAILNINKGLEHGKRKPTAKRPQMQRNINVNRK